MTKSSTALMSLVAAIPGAFLTYLLVMAFLSHADSMGVALNALVGVTLLCSIIVALTPVGIMLLGGPKGAAKSKPAPKSQDDDGDDSVVGLQEADDDESASEAFTDSDASSEFVEDFESGSSSDLLGESDDSDEMLDDSDQWGDSESALSDEFEFEDGLSDDDLEFDFEDEEK